MARTRTMFAIRNRRLDLFFNGAPRNKEPDQRNIWHACGRRYDEQRSAFSAVDGAIAARLFTRDFAVRNIEVVETQERTVKRYRIGGNDESRSDS